MRFPIPKSEVQLHKRILRGDPIASSDLFRCFIDPLSAALKHDLGCTDDEAYDSGVDAVLAYLDSPRTYDLSKGRLSTYLVDIAKKRAIDRLRSRTASEGRTEKYAMVVELTHPAPKERLDTEVEAEELWDRVKQELPDERDCFVLKLILAGESSTEVLAKALDLSALSPLEQRDQVKRHRDRLMKVLERLGKKLGL